MIWNVRGGRRPAAAKRNDSLLPAALHRRRRRIAASWGLAGLLLVATGGCGREAPSFAPGSLTVTSEPPGATILLDRQDTGLLTPHTFAELEAAVYGVSVHLDGWVTTPAEETVELRPLDVRLVAFTLSQTGLAVTSDPVGARILIDGLDTGLVTPAVVGGLEPGPVEVALALDDWLVFPASFTATVTAGQVGELPGDTFTLRPRRTVVLEGFANIDCGPCPQLTANLLALTSRPGYGPDRVLFVEFSVSWPNFQDPFYLANAAENSARYTFYQVLGAPTLIADGVTLADAVDPDLLQAAVDAGLGAEPGLLIDVDADPTQAAIPVTVTLTPLRDLDLSGQQLFVALYEDELTVTPAPGSNGQTEFHHVFRDRVDALPVLGALAAGVPQTFDLTLQRGDRAPGSVVVLAFVQDPTTRAVLQAGSTALSAHAPAALFDTGRPAVAPEGHRP